MPTCCIANCKNSTKKGEKIYMASFPVEKTRKWKWIDNIGIKNWTPSKCAVVCGVHFSDEMWENVREDGTKRLKRSAVPTISLDIKLPIIKHEQEVNSLSTEIHISDVKWENVYEDDTKELETTALDLKIPISHHEQGLNTVFAEITVQMQRMEVQLQKAMEIIKTNENTERSNEMRIQNAMKIIAKQDRSNKYLIKRNRQLKKIISKLEERNQETIIGAVKKIFNEDQLQALITDSSPPVWSSNTIKKALRLKLACGPAGYNELLAQNLPLPAVRTLRRKIHCISSEERVSDDFQLFQQKLQHCSTSAETDCILDLDEMEIQSGDY